MASMQTTTPFCAPLARSEPGMRQANQGFTTIELMTVVAIMAILVALAAPSFNGLIERWRVRDTAEAITSTMYYARSEAIKRGGGVTINATGGWNTGWKVNHTQNSVTTELKVNSAPNKISIDPDPVATILYVDRWGMLSETNGGAAAAMDIALYPTGKGATDNSAIRLCIASGGRIVQMKQGEACPA